MKLIAFVFMKSGGHEVHFGEVRYRLDKDTPLTDTTVFQPGWERAPWLDKPEPITELKDYPICTSDKPCAMCK